MSVRRTVELRRKRERREARERAWRESVCGGPLVDQSRPVIGGSTAAEAHGHLIHEIFMRNARIERETQLLLVAFARGCCVRLHAERQMIADVQKLLWRVGGPWAQPTYSTIGGTVTPGRTIPRL